MVLPPAYYSTYHLLPIAGTAYSGQESGRNRLGFEQVGLEWGFEQESLILCHGLPDYGINYLTLFWFPHQLPV